MKGNLFFDNFTEIIIAVVGLVLLGVAVWHVYQVTAHADVTAAKRMMDSLEGKTNALRVGEEGAFTFQSPCTKDSCDWFLTGWDVQDSDRPDVCYFKACLCACKGDYKNRATSCASGGVCRTFGFDDIAFLAFTPELHFGGGAPGTGPTASLPPTLHRAYQFHPQLNTLLVNRTVHGIEVRVG